MRSLRKTKQTLRMSTSRTHLHFPVVCVLSASARGCHTGPRGQHFGGADLKLGAQPALLGVGLQPLVWGTRHAWVTVTRKRRVQAHRTDPQPGWLRVWTGMSHSWRLGGQVKAQAGRTFPGRRRLRLCCVLAMDRRTDGAGALWGLCLQGCQSHLGDITNPHYLHGPSSKHRHVGVQHMNLGGTISSTGF